jgi:hypothetical protein
MTATPTPEPHTSEPDAQTATIIDVAENARYWIDQAGGLASKNDLARRWGVSRQRVRALEEDPTFPAPLGWVNGHPAYGVREVDAWRDDRLRSKGS